MAWEVNKLYRTRNGKQARFLGLMDAKNPFQTHVFAINSGPGAGETAMLFSENGMYGSNDKSYRQHDVISDEPTPGERAFMTAVRGASSDEELLAVIRERAGQ